MSGDPPPDLHYGYLPHTVGSSTYFAAFRPHPAVPLVLRREYYPAGSTGLHHHHADFIALYSVRAGSGVHIIDEHPYAITRGDVYLMPAGARHGYADHLKLEIDAFYFTTALFSDGELIALREQPGFWSLFANDGRNDHRLHLVPEKWPALESQIEELRTEWARRDAAAPLLLRSGFFRLLVWLARGLQISSSGSGPSASGIANAIQYCEANFESALTVPQLAARAFLSPGHFSELFNRQVGMPPAAYIRRLRLEKARSLLKSTDLSAGQVALQTGFGDAAHFTRAFRAAFGTTPTKYRQSQRVRT